MAANSLSLTLHQGFLKMERDQRVAERVKEKILRAMLHPPTGDQLKFIDRFGTYAEESSEGIFILRGYAGTGKTTLMSAIAQSFQSIVLLAPTGRAAKVLSVYTKRPAFTIHKHLYTPAMTSDGRLLLKVNENRFYKTLFIVDEASMIPDASIDDAESAFPGVNLLSDLINYVYSGNQCRLLLVGDTAQLPPVHFDTSPALDSNHLRYRFRREVYEVELTEVVRQEHDSGILKNATALRILIKKNRKEPILKTSGFDDIIRVDAREMTELLNDLYREHGKENVLVITRSNKSAIQFNKMIRHYQLWMEEEIGAGDNLMVVKNNYSWLPDDHKAGFIANGDVLEVQKIHRFEERFGFRFAYATLTLQDYPDEIPFEARIILNTLSSESPALTNAESRKLYDEVNAFYELDEKDRRRRSALIKKDPWYNALQVKFSYAVTCHKAQGGQWTAVFVDQGYLTEEMMGTEYLRWLYTAFTRAKKSLYLVNFDEKFFKD